MNNNSRPRKRKGDEVDETNDILRQALGKRPVPTPLPASQPARSSKEGVARPEEGSNKRKPVNLARLRSLVDGRVEDWKSKQTPADPSQRQRSSHNETNLRKNAAPPSRTRPTTFRETPIAGPSSGAPRRYVTENPEVTASRTNANAKVKRRKPTQSSGERKRRPTGCRSQVSSKPQTTQSTPASGTQQRPLAKSKTMELPTDDSDGRAIKQEQMPDIAPKDDDESSDDGGIIEVVDTRKRRKLEDEAT